MTTTRLFIIFWLIVGLTQWDDSFPRSSGVIIASGLEHIASKDSSPPPQQQQQQKLRGGGGGTGNSQEESSTSTTMTSSHPFPSSLLLKTKTTTATLEIETSNNNNNNNKDPEVIMTSKTMKQGKEVPQEGIEEEEEKTATTSNNKNNQKKAIEGVSFSRIISQFPTDASVTMEFLTNKTVTAATTTTTTDIHRHHHDPVTSISTGTLKRVCTSTDTYGDNDCHYNWDDDVIIKYSIESKTTFTESDYVTGHFMIDGRIPWSFKCKMCGEDCILEVPVVKADFSIPMPPCPVKPKKRSHTLSYLLPKTSPSHGWVTTSFEGTVMIISGGDDSDHPIDSSSTTTKEENQQQQGVVKLGEHSITTTTTSSTTIAQFTVSATVL